MLRAENKEDRIWFTKEQRIQIFKENYKVCACCGKKLTPKTMTMEHIIPLNRGGKNERENLCCLCYDCNQKKGNTFYLPYGYYLAISESARFKEMLGYVAGWYKSLPESEKIDLKRYPLITPAMLSIAHLGGNTDFKGHRKQQNVVVSPSLTFKWELVGKSLYDEAEAVTGQSIRDIRSYVCHEMAGLEKADADAGVYLLRKPSNDKLLALVAVRYCEEKNAFFLYVPWTDASKLILSSLMLSFTLQLIRILTYIAEKEVNYYVVESPQWDAVNGFWDEKFDVCVDADIGKERQYYVSESDDGKTTMHRIVVMRNSMEDLLAPVQEKLRKGE